MKTDSLYSFGFHGWRAKMTPKEFLNFKNYILEYSKINGVQPVYDRVDPNKIILGEYVGSMVEIVYDPDQQLCKLFTELFSVRLKTSICKSSNIFDLYQAQLKHYNRSRQHLADWNIRRKRLYMQDWDWSEEIVSGIISTIKRIGYHNFKTKYPFLSNEEKLTRILQTFLHGRICFIRAFKDVGIDLTCEKLISKGLLSDKYIKYDGKKFIDYHWEELLSFLFSNMKEYCEYSRNNEDFDIEKSGKGRFIYIKNVHYSNDNKILLSEYPAHFEGKRDPWYSYRNSIIFKVKEECNI